MITCLEKSVDSLIIVSETTEMNLVLWKASGDPSKRTLKRINQSKTNCSGKERKLEKAN